LPAQPVQELDFRATALRRRHAADQARLYTRDADDRLRADLIEQLMCRDVIDLPAFGADHDIDFAHYFADELDGLEPLMPTDCSNAARNRYATHVVSDAALQPVPD
jgi:oxygen-independent coproporphyrinogen-3 oxidase